MAGHYTGATHSELLIMCYQTVWKGRYNNFGYNINSVNIIISNCVKISYWWSIPTESAVFVKGQ